MPPRPSSRTTWALCQHSPRVNLWDDTFWRQKCHVWLGEREKGQWEQLSRISRDITETKANGFLKCR